MAALKTIDEHFSKEGQDLLSQFDLIAGTSIGGLFALFLSMLKAKGGTTEEVLLEGTDILDTFFEECFSQLSPYNLLCCNTMMPKNAQLIDYFESIYDQSLYLPDAMPAMVCISSAKNDNLQKTMANESISDAGKREFEPLVARTYKYPESSLEKDKPLAYSTCNMKIYEAMAATSAAPLLADRVRVKVDGRTRVMADGLMYSNCPMALAIDEARRLYPGRPIGTILNIGYGDREEKLINRTIDATRLVHPNLHFQRICPIEIMSDFSPIEFDLKVIAAMQAKVEEWMISTPRVKNMIEATVAKLYSSAPRTFGCNRHRDVLSHLNASKGYRRRSMIRKRADDKLKRSLATKSFVNQIRMSMITPFSNVKNSIKLEHVRADTDIEEESTDSTVSDINGAKNSTKLEKGRADTDIEEEGANSAVSDINGAKNKDSSVARTSCGSCILACCILFACAVILSSFILHW